MKRKTIITIVGMAVALAVGVVVLAARFDLSALPEPGSTETAIATSAKHLLVARASRTGVPPGSKWSESSAAAGQKLYGVECSLCHGLNGHTSTDNGRWMYPRAADLTSPEVQRYSDADLFWIMKNGIRLSGMPGFGKVETDEHLWQLVHFVRSLRAEQKHP